MVDGCRTVAMVLSMISLVTVSLLMDWLFKERPLFHSKFKDFVVRKAYRKTGKYS
jgi:hypothetical protein